jgi:hypothetical protein
MWDMIVSVGKNRSQIPKSPYKRVLARAFAGEIKKN